MISPRRVKSTGMMAPGLSLRHLDTAGIPYISLAGSRGHDTYLWSARAGPGFPHIRRRPGRPSAVSMKSGSHSGQQEISTWPTPSPTLKAPTSSTPSHRRGPAVPQARREPGGTARDGANALSLGEVKNPIAPIQVDGDQDIVGVPVDLLSCHPRTAESDCMVWSVEVSVVLNLLLASTYEHEADKDVPVSFVGDLMTISC